MIEFLDAHVAWWHWVAVGLLLALGEMLIPSFFLLLIGASAVVVGLLLTVLPLGFNLQLMIWAGLSALNVFLWFRVVQPRIPDRTRSGMAMETLVGQAGTLVAVNPETLRGRVRFPA
ncbi:MAG: NfeD family protein, partial [Oceanococcaceae bacterium]